MSTANEKPVRIATSRLLLVTGLALGIPAGIYAAASMAVDDTPIAIPKVLDGTAGFERVKNTPQTLRDMAKQLQVMANPDAFGKETN